MGSIALTGLLTGLALGGAERRKKEREENEELITTRLKIAAVNKKKRDEETAARKEVLSGRYSAVSPYLPDGIDEEQKLALISNPEITKDFIDRRQRNEDVDLKTYLITNKDKVPANFGTVQKYIDSLSSAPSAVSPDQMTAALGGEKGLFGSRTAVSQGRAERIARSIGAGASAGQLLAYEDTTPVTAEPLLDVARLNTELYPKNIKKPEEQLDYIQGKVVQFSTRFGEEDPRTVQARKELAATESAIDTLSRAQYDWSKRRPKLIAIIASPETSVNDKRNAETELQRGDAVDKNMVSPDTLFKFAQTAGTKAVEARFGSLIDKSIAVVTTPEGGSSYRYIGDPGEDVRKEIDAVYAGAVRDIASRYMDPVTKGYMNDGYRAAIESILSGVGKAPATPVPSPNAVTSPATRISVPEAAATPPASRGLAARPEQAPNIAQVRRDAQMAIAGGANQEAVKRRFKELTGQDY